MNKVILTIGLVLLCTSYSYSQMAQTRSRRTSNAQASASADAKDKTVNLSSGTQLSGELQNTVDVRKAKVGDEVVLKTTQAIKSEGRTVVNNGARLIGHVTEVSQKTEANGESHIGIIFDRLQNGSVDAGIAANIVSIAKTQVSPLRNDSEIDSSGSATSSARPTPSSQRNSSSGSVLGGVVGGVTNSVGGVVNSTSAVTSDVLGNTTTAVGSTVNGSTNAVGRSVGRIQISESTDASASGGSVLTLRGDNLRLEKGITFGLVLTQSVGAGTQQ